MVLGLYPARWTSLLPAGGQVTPALRIGIVALVACRPTHAAVLWRELAH